ncbi:hypothetical protein [Sorangium atrum]|uniref:Uncharacterized protein n=1 Tax=Sorangium atrum TaxID=2995308 RepID=A0ABT5BWD2_9BACT|nr:hypothetical protein [Sorangium aterium]MDC0678446.1 hypothetical protein [Sorangium aterium]
MTQGAGACAPLCAFPLFGKNLQILVPLQRVLLMFSTVPIAPGTAIERSYGPGILVEREGADERAITFDINASWSWGGFAWAQQVPASADIVPLLVVPSAVAP